MPDTINALVRDLSDDDRSVRQAAEDGLVALGMQAVDSLLPHVGVDGSSRLKWSAESVLQRLGDEALPRLREIRSHGPGGLRSNALKVLVDLGGAEYLDEGDRSAVERLVRVKLKNELPVRVPSEAGRWLAFPAERVDDAVAALGLHDLRPATTIMGVAAATQATDSLEFQSSQGKARTAYRVFITPAFETWLSEVPIQNWRMLWGNSFIDQLDGFTLADKLSERCGEAHFYVIDPYNSAENWYVAREGHRVRSFGSYDLPRFRGEPLPFEVEYREDADEDEAEEYAEGVPYALTAADMLSVEPGRMPASSTHGHGWLATTHPDVPNSRFKGALPI
ncbi:HEAT repeat domain-containing protein [Streptomyces sp. R11]|uniref:HEAT repeat domain-containing protein n=1 Tax=Streptomyces sp. R11 TaxID=3238625 RepID=A0AB39N7I1_9ACTN